MGITARVTLAVLAAIGCWLLVATLVLRPDSAERLWHAELQRLERKLSDLPTDFQKTTLLREYVGEMLDVGRLDADARSVYRGVDFQAFQPAEFFPLYRDNRLPANCGYTTFFYIKLLQSFGYDAYQYSFGFTKHPYERFIHSVVLVEIETSTGKRLIIQDPYLNLTYRTRAGEPMDFMRFLSLIKARQYHRIARDARSVDTHLLVPDVSIYHAHLDARCQGLMTDVLKRPDGSLANEIPLRRDYATLMQSPCDHFENKFSEALRKNGIDEPFLYAYTIRASEMVGSGDPKGVQQRIDSLLR